MIRSLAFIAAHCIAALAAAAPCPSYTFAGQAFVPGTVYRPCQFVQFTPSEPNVVVFESDGSLALTEATRTSSETNAAFRTTPGSDGNGYSMTVRGDGNVVVTSDAGVLLWESAPSSLAYPGRPSDSERWQLTAQGQRMVTLYQDNSFVFWSSEAPATVTFATERPYGYNPLGTNEYVSATADGQPAFFLHQIDGRFCAYEGVYPTATKVLSCVH